MTLAGRSSQMVWIWVESMWIKPERNRRKRTGRKHFGPVKADPGEAKERLVERDPNRKELHAIYVAAKGIGRLSAHFEPAQPGRRRGRAPRVHQDPEGQPCQTDRAECSATLVRDSDIGRESVPTTPDGR